MKNHERFVNRREHRVHREMMGRVKMRCPLFSVSPAANLIFVLSVFLVSHIAAGVVFAQDHSSHSHGAS